MNEKSLTIGQTIALKFFYFRVFRGKLNNGEINKEGSKMEGILLI